MGLLVASCRGVGVLGCFSVRFSVRFSVVVARQRQETKFFGAKKVLARKETLKK